MEEMFNGKPVPNYSKYTITPLFSVFDEEGNNLSQCRKGKYSATIKNENDEFVSLDVKEIVRNLFMEDEIREINEKWLYFDVLSTTISTGNTFYISKCPGSNIYVRIKPDATDEELENFFEELNGTQII